MFWYVQGTQLADIDTPWQKFKKVNKNRRLDTDGLQNDSKEHEFIYMDGLWLTILQTEQTTQIVLSC